MIYKKITKSGFVPFITKGFTFGFEIEGAFHKNLLDLLPKGGHFKDDGSVRVNGDSDNFIKGDDRINVDDNDSYYAKEYNSPVFQTIEELIECLLLFSRKEKNYFSNDSCGVHLHIGYKGRKDILANKFGTKEIMEQLQNRFMPLICDCVKERIAGQQAHWCNLHKEFRDGRANNNNKYFAVNLHYSGTIELRLFSPCTHLIANIQKVLTEFFRVGYRDFKGEAMPVTCIVNAGEKVGIVEVITPDKQSYTYGFNKDSEYSISPLAQVADFKEYQRLENSVRYGMTKYQYQDWLNGNPIQER